MCVCVCVHSPMRPSETRQQQSLVLGIHVHDAGSLKLLSDPVTLFQGVDEHELNT